MGGAPAYESHAHRRKVADPLDVAGAQCDNTGMSERMEGEPSASAPTNGEASAAVTPAGTGAAPSTTTHTTQPAATHTEGGLRAVELSWTDWMRLWRLPWGTPLEQWQEQGVTLLSIRRGESRHQVIFVEAGGRRYAIKETSPEAARHEITILQELKNRHARALEPVGYIVTYGAPIAVGEMGGAPLYMSGDSGYCITRLAERVLPQSILYRYPFTPANKRLLLNAVAELLLDLHEAGVYWGDPSLANVLIDLSGQRLTAVMADGETAELVAGTLGEGLRRQDLALFAESLEWQAEDIRLARGLPEDEQVMTESDGEYFLARYVGLRSERAGGGQGGETIFARLLDLEHQVQRLNALGYGVLTMGTSALRGLSTTRVPKEVARISAESEGNSSSIRVATLRPNWYVHRLRELLGVRVPRQYAPRIYQHLTIHKWLLSEQAGHDVGIEAAARDWYTRYHQPALAFIEAYEPGADLYSRYARYLAILDHTWAMSRREGRTVPIEEGAMDFALAESRAELSAEE